MSNSKRTLSRAGKNFIAGVSLIAFVAILVAVSVAVGGGDGFDLYALTGRDDEETTETVEQTERQTTVVNTTVPVEPAASASEYAYAGFEPRLADMTAEWNMLLVNRCYCLPEDFEVELAEAVSGTGMRLDKRVAPYYQQMYDDAAQDGIRLTPISGYRSIEKQRNIFNNKINRFENQGLDKIAATKKAAETSLLPGTSEHNAGLAMDIAKLEQNFDQSDAFAWLEENAADYGFIMRYPEDKTEITGVSYEPWHWRYVGEATAKEIKASGKCLEEYFNIYLF